MTIATIQILGRIGKDPELRKTGAGTSVCSLTLAVSDGTKDNQHTTWFRCNAWEKTADTIHKFFKKGDLIFIQGAPASRDWTNNEGQKQTSFEVTINRFAFAGQKKPEDPQPARTTEPENNHLSDDDIPF